MKKYLIFLLLMLPVLAFTQDKFCPEGDKYYPKCDDHGNWDKCMEGVRDGKAYKYLPGLEGSSKTCVCQTLGENYPDVVALKKQLARLKVSDAKQYQKLAQLAEKDVEQDSRLDDHEKRIKGLETWKSTEAQVTPKGPTVVDESKKEKPIEKLEDVAKKPDPKLGDPIPLPTETVYQEPWAFFAPEIGVNWMTNKSPEFTSKSLWGASVGLLVRADPPTLKGVFFFLKPSWVVSFGKVYLPETTPSPYPIQAVSQNGFLIEGGAGYKFWNYTELFLGYAYALSKGAEHHQGAFAGLEFGAEKVPLKLQFGVRYEHDLNWFGGLLLRVPIKPHTGG